LCMMAFADLPPMYSARYRSAHYRDFTLRTMAIALTNHGFGIEAVIGTHFYFPGFGDVLSGLASWLPRWASQIVIKAQKTAMSQYSAKEAASVDIYSRKKN